MCACVIQFIIHKGRRSEAKREREVFEEASVACSSLARGRPVSSALSTLPGCSLLQNNAKAVILNSAAYSLIFNCTTSLAS